MNEITKPNIELLPDGYAEWCKDIEHLIEVSKLHTAINVNADTLLSKKFPNDRGYSLNNLKSMRRFAEAYQNFPFLKVPLAQIG